MARPRTWTDEQLRLTVQMSRTWVEVAARLGLSGPNEAIRRRADELDLDWSHFLRGIGNVDTREYEDWGMSENPLHVLTVWAAKKAVCEVRVTTEILKMRRRGFELREIADAAGLSVLEVAQIVGAGRAGS